MLDITNKTIGAIFSEAVNLWPNEIFFISPQTSKSPLIKISYLEALGLVTRYEKILSKSGCAAGERVALLLGNKVDHYLIKLAANNLGISVVPINPEASPDEILYILNDSRAVITFTDEKYLFLINKVNKISINLIKFFNIDETSQSFPTKTKNLFPRKVSPNSEASLIYTSGTTGHPKGCILSHEYEIEVGNSYASRKGLISLKEGEDRIYNPLPVHHVNAAVFSFYGVMLTGNCQIQDERFSSSNWWKVIIRRKLS